MAIQSVLETAVHAQPSATATVTVPLPPDAGTFCDAGLIDASHDGAGGVDGGAAACACEMPSVWPATSTVPVRGPPLFAETVRPTLPLPVPLDPALTVIQSDWLTAVHPQVPPDCTFTAIDPPCAGTVVFETVTSNRQAGSCVIATCVLLTSIMPRRDAGSVFAAMR